MYSAFVASCLSIIKIYDCFNFKHVIYLCHEFHMVKKIIIHVRQFET